MTGGHGMRRRLKIENPMVDAGVTAALKKVSVYITRHQAPVQGLPPQAPASSDCSARPVAGSIGGLGASKQSQDSDRILVLGQGVCTKGPSRISRIIHHKDFVTNWKEN